jgi:hypothetical protein
MYYNQLQFSFKYIKEIDMGDYNKGYRTLTVDLKTYELLQEICSLERRKKIDQIRLMVETNHKKVMQQQEGEAV